MSLASPTDIADRCERMLFGSVLRFWVQHSEDREHGGFFNCLDEDGAVYDKTKHVWLQGRQIWMYAKLYNEYPSEAWAAACAAAGVAVDRDAVLASAIRAATFLDAHVRDPRTGHFYCALAADGRASLAQRKMFSACFFVMACSELCRATADSLWRERADQAMEEVLRWYRDPSLLGRVALPGSPALSPLSPPMIILNLLNELRVGAWAHAGGAVPGWVEAEERACVQAILTHVKAVDALPPAARSQDGSQLVVLENVGADGQALLDCCEGRLLNPGHAIETGWFLMQHAARVGDDEGVRRGARVVEDSFLRGWDTAHGGGILYFLDLLGHSPTQLEWNMKLWWPHSEAMIGFAMAYRLTRSEHNLERLRQVCDYTLSHFADEVHGEWYGYLDRRGEVTHRFKGGPYKGCFHVPRALLLCTQLLRAAGDATA